MKTALIASILVLATAAASQAATYNVSVLNNTSGPTAGIGYDPDKAAPTVTPTGFHASGLVGDYNSVRFTPESIGMAGLVANQIQSVSYEAANAVADTLDWRLKLYTVNETNGQTGWYGFRIEAPTTASGTTATFHPLLAYDRITKGDGSQDFSAENGALSSDFLTALGQASTQKVLFIDISAGSLTGGHAYDTTLNNISISATGFQSAVITAVPEPTTLAAIAGGAVLLLGRRRRRA